MANLMSQLGEWFLDEINIGIIELPINRLSSLMGVGPLQSAGVLNRTKRSASLSRRDFSSRMLSNSAPSFPLRLPAGRHTGSALLT